MLRQSDAPPPLTPEEQIEKLIRDQVDVRPTGRQWDTTTTRMALAACASGVMIATTLGVTWADLGDSLRDITSGF